MLLFEGYQQSYGTYGAELEDNGSGKLKGQAHTIKDEITVELWIKHLAGRQGLGVIPIREDSKVKFAAIDIDEYPLDLMKLNENIQRHKMPLVLCRTKSGGAHLFLFLDLPTEAKPVQKKMREMAATLGYGNAEIFPKQTKIMISRGDMGSWINMPYFNSAQTTRYALDDKGNQLKFHEFVRHCQSKIVNFSEVDRLKSVNRDLLPDGPPCLNHLLSMGFPEGTRNNAMFNLAVYAKKAFGDAWQQNASGYNGLYMVPPLEPSEVQGILKSVQKKEFTYTCKQAPICNYCDMPKCRTRRYGIGHGDSSLPLFGSLTKLMTDPPVWFLEVDGGGRLELTTEELQNPRMFQNKCMKVLNTMPILPKMEVWQEIVHKLLSEVNEVEVSQEATPRGQLWIHLETFLTGRVQARTREEILLGKPWLDKGHYYFRLNDFLAYIERQRFKIMLQQVSVYFQEWKVQVKFFNINGKGVNTHSISSRSFSKLDQEFQVPKMNNPEEILS